MPDVSVSGPSLLTLSILASAITHTCSAVSATRRVHVGVFTVVRMTLRAERLLGKVADRPFARSVARGWNGGKMGRVAAAPVRAPFPFTALQRIVTQVIEDHTLRDLTLGQLVGHGVGFHRSTPDVYGPVALGESAIPWPAITGFAPLNERPIAGHWIAEGAGPASALRGTVAPEAEIVRVTQAQLLDVYRLFAAVDPANQLRHV